MIPFWTLARKWFAKTDSNGSRPTDVPMDPKPTIDLSNLNGSRQLEALRRRRMEAAIRTSDEDRKKITAVLRKYRSRQTKRLGYRVEDPDPYEPEYLFYCLDSRIES
jgi:hypothetical protein